MTYQELYDSTNLLILGTTIASTFVGYYLYLKLIEDPITKYIDKRKSNKNLLKSSQLEKTLQQPNPQ